MHLLSLTGVLRTTEVQSAKFRKGNTDQATSSTVEVSAEVNAHSESAFSGQQRFNRRSSGKGNTDQATSSTVALTPEVNAHSRSHRCYQDHGGSNGCVQKSNTDQARCSKARHHNHRSTSNFREEKKRRSMAEFTEGGVGGGGDRSNINNGPSAVNARNFRDTCSAGGAHRSSRDNVKATEVEERRHPTPHSETN